MKKFIFILITVFISLAVIAQENKKVVWDYPVKPGTDTWTQFKSTTEMYEACQIPDAILKKLDTESLVGICYDYPAYMTLFLYNTPQAGFDAFYSHFNGIRELLSRKDVGHFILKKYCSISSSDIKPLWTSAEKGLYAYKSEYFEIILAQPQVVQSLNTEDRKLLLKEVVKKYDDKIEKSDIFGGTALSVNAWIMANNLNQEEKLSAKSLQPQVDQSLKSGIFVEHDLYIIYQQAKKYIDE
jgi:hypothetical protein